MLATAVDIAREAGRLALGRRSTVSSSEKRDGTWVTEADRDAEALIRRRLTDAFPGHSIHGEEMGGEDTHGHCWLVDPIDGTLNYITGIPIWGVSIGLLTDGVPAAGVFYMPVTGDLFSAEAGGGAFLNGERISPDGRGVIDRNAMLAVNSDALWAYEVRSPAMIRNLGSAAIHGCYVGSGTLTAAVFLNCHAWDLAACLCIALEAGAVARWLDGSPVTTISEDGPDSARRPSIIGPEYAVEAILPALRLRADALASRQDG